jgi:hypothetical protein
MTRDNDSTSYNMRFPNEVYEELKQFQVRETLRPNRAVSLHECIIRAVKAATSGKTYIAKVEAEG